MRTRLRVRAAALWPAALVLGAAGCGGGPYAPVSGTVRYNGAPLSGAQVLFQPVAAPGSGGDAGGAGSYARCDAAGRFTLEAATATPTPGALPGRHTVRVSLPPAEADAGESDAAAGRGKAPKPNPIPKQYNEDSTLTFDVPAGGTDKADFDLAGPPLPKR